MKHENKLRKERKQKKEKEIVTRERKKDLKSF